MSQLLDEAAAREPVRGRESLPLKAMRLAEQAHRGIRRKAPAGEDRPDYFLHLCEVAWRLQAAHMPDEVIAAGFLHDVIEDCGYTRASLADAFGDAQVAELVEWVSEPEHDHASWQARNSAYRDRLRRAPAVACALSCADKTANIEDMLRLVRKGYAVGDFLSVGADAQVAKFRALRELFNGQVPAVLLAAFDDALTELVERTGAERQAAVLDEA